MKSQFEADVTDRLTITSCLLLQNYKYEALEQAAGEQWDIIRHNDGLDRHDRAERWNTHQRSSSSYPVRIVSPDIKYCPLPFLSKSGPHRDKINNSYLS
jgi:hypothetical protein